MHRTWRRILTLNLNAAARWRAVAVALAAGLPLAACAVATPLAITSTGAGMARGSAVALELPQDRMSERGRFSAALIKAMMERSVTLDDQAALLADFSMTTAPASGGVLKGTGANVEGEPEKDWIAAPRPGRRFDKCEAKRLRATLILYDRSSRNIVYRGSGEATDCAFDDADLAALASGLVEDALTRSPR